MDKPLKETLTIEFKSDRKCLPMDDLYKEVVAILFRQQSNQRRPAPEQREDGRAVCPNAGE